MTRLAARLDLLPHPQFPDDFSEQDRRMVLLALASAKQQIAPYDGKFEAPWLLSPFPDEVWDTTNRGREEMVDGQWQNTIRFDWRVPLPNGALLTDVRYEHLLMLLKKIAFLMRSGLVAGNSTPAAWRNGMGKLIALIRWTVLHEEKFMPELYGLRLIDQPSLEWLFCLVAEGGWFHALQIPQRILAVLYQGAHGISCPQSLLNSPFTIPIKEIEPLVQWMECQGLYCHAKDGAHMGKRHLKRNPIARLIGESPSSFTTPNVSGFLRQFEPDFGNESLLVQLRQGTEFPSQKVISIQDVRDGGASEEAIVALEKAIGTVLDAHRHVPDLLPEPAHISLRRATNIAKRVTSTSSHTLFIPINTGLAFLNTAMRFVHVYGEAIVGFYLAVIADFNPTTPNPSTNRSLNRRLNDWRIASGESIAAVLNITEFRRKDTKTNFDRLRSNPTLDQALRVLIGSCIVCMALLKPSREEELTHLKRNCMREDADGYWFNYERGKSNSGEVWQDEDRPIPVISAKAIHLLQLLGSSLSTLFADERKINDNLFYLPRVVGMEALIAHSDLLNKHLDIFCDFVGLPPDMEGRRWYVRVHEMRKWFLLLLFWSGRFDVLDAARWIAGHTNAKHIYAYIEKEFPGEELPQIEAEYSIDRVYRRDQERRRAKGDAGNEDGVDELYEAVLRHFNVESLTMVPEPEWTSYVQSLRKDEKFRLEPHSIFGEDGRNVVGINISFVMRQVT
ncbi:MAG: hypothetical protein ACYC4S_12095 [Rhodoferax sp.]